MANKVAFGLKNVHIAKITESHEGVISYEAPKLLPGGVSLSTDSKTESNTFYADNTAYFISDGAKKTELELEIAIVPDWFASDFLGAKYDENGNLVSSTFDKSSHFALLFEVEGDKKATRHIYYDCLASSPKEEYKTMEEKVEIKAIKMNISAYGAGDNQVIKGKTTEKTKEDAYNNWYKNVTLPKQLTASPQE